MQLAIKNIQDIKKSQELKNNNSNEFYQLLGTEIPKPIWIDKQETSCFQQIGLYRDVDNQLKLQVQITPNTKLWTKFTDKKIVFFASGVTEWIILDCLDVDYIVIKSNSVIRDTLEYKDYLSNKILAILPNFDEPTNIDFLQSSFHKVITVNAYDADITEKNFREYTRSYFKSSIATKENFRQALLEAVYYSETDNIFDQENINEELVYNKIKDQTVKNKYKSASNIKSETISVMCLNYLPLAKNTVNMISSFGGQGKTWLALNIALQTLKENQNRKILYWTKEDKLEYLKYRIELLKNNFYKNTDIANLFLHNATSDFDFYEDYFDLIILDPLLSFFNGDNENDNKQARNFVAQFVNFAEKTNTTILFIHHAGKNFNAEFKTRGASAFVDSTRLLWEIKYISGDSEEKDYDIYTQRKVFLKKDNYGIANIINGFSKIVTIKPRIKFDIDIADKNTRNETEEVF